MGLAANTPAPNLVQGMVFRQKTTRPGPWRDPRRRNPQIL